MVLTERRCSRSRPSSATSTTNETPPNSMTVGACRRLRTLSPLPASRRSPITRESSTYSVSPFPLSLLHARLLLDIYRHIAIVEGRFPEHRCTAVFPACQLHLLVHEGPTRRQDSQCASLRHRAYGSVFKQHQQVFSLLDHLVRSPRFIRLRALPMPVRQDRRENHAAEVLLRRIVPVPLGKALVIRPAAHLHKQVVPDFQRFILAGILISLPFYTVWTALPPQSYKRRRPRNAERTMQFLRKSRSYAKISVGMCYTTGYNYLLI